MKEVEKIKEKEFQDLVDRNSFLESRVEQLERELQKSRGLEKHYRMIADFTKDWEFWIGPDKKFLYVSPGCEAVTGYQPRKFIEDPEFYFKIIHPDDLAQFRDHAVDQLSEAEHPPIDFRVRSQSGRWVWVSHTCKAVFDEDGKFLGRRGSNRDITARKRIEEALSAGESRYHAMFEGMSSCAAVYSVSEDGLEFFFKDFNRAAEVSSGLKRKDIIGSNVRDVFPGVSELGLLDVFRRVYRTGEPELHPAAQYRDQRIEIWVENFVYRLPSGELVALYQDLTSEK